MFCLMSQFSYFADCCSAECRWAGCRGATKKVETKKEENHSGESLKKVLLYFNVPGRFNSRSFQLYIPSIRSSGFVLLCKKKPALLAFAMASLILSDFLLDKIIL
jgi:hypothetical protein